MEFEHYCCERAVGVIISLQSSVWLNYGLQRHRDLRFFHTGCGLVRHQIRCERTLRLTYSEYSSFILHLVWPHQLENPPGRPRADQSIKKPMLVSLVSFSCPLNTIMLGAPTVRWSS